MNQLTLSGKSGYGMNGCCTGNVHQGWPKFIMSGFQTKGATLVVSGYSPFEASLDDGTTVTTGGQYPWADSATVTIARKTRGPWGLQLRIPCWVSSATVDVDGGQTHDADACALFDVPGLSDDDQTFSATVTFGHDITVTADKWKSPKGAVEISRGPLLFTFPVPGAVNVTSLNGTYIEETFVKVDNSKPWQIALQNPSTTTSFSGFGPVPDVPFDRDAPPATITAKACATKGLNGYDKGRVPDSPVKLTACDGDMIDVKLVPLAHSNLRLTVLPVLADDLE